MSVNIILGILLFKQSLLIVYSEPFFNNDNSVIYEKKSLTNPYLTVQITNDFELRLVCNTTLSKRNNDDSITNVKSLKNTLKRVVIADMANPTTLHVKMDYHPKMYRNEECSHVAKENARGLGNVKRRVKSVECLIFNETNTFLFAVTLQGEITDDDLIIWSCGVKYEGERLYTVSVNREAYTFYGLTGIMDPLNDVFNRPKPKIDLIVIPEATSPSLVTVGCTIPGSKASSPFAHHDDVFSIMRPIKFTGPNGFFVKGDILGKRWISDHITTCDFTSKSSSTSGFNNDIPVITSRRSVHPDDVVAACYDYNSSPICGIRPKVTLFADREFVDSGHFYIPSNKDVNGLISPASEYNDESWLFP